MEPVLEFSQDDLIPDDVMLLDTGNAIFMWIGGGANAEEKSSAEVLAKVISRSAPWLMGFPVVICSHHFRYSFPHTFAQRKSL